MFIYILECKDGSYYTGVTNNIDRRLAEHQNGLDSNSYTASRKPVRLVFSQFIDNPLEAIEAEKQIKRWSHEKKEALMHGDWDKLKLLAKKRWNKK